MLIPLHSSLQRRPGTYIWSRGASAETRLYNHIRTVAFYMDAAPLLTDLGLPFRAGLDDIISLVPLWGDIVSGILGLYQVWLSFLFGVPLNILGYMVRLHPHHLTPRLEDLGMPDDSCSTSSWTSSRVSFQS